MSNGITMSELQEFIAACWYTYDEMNYDEMAAAKDDGMRARHHQLGTAVRTHRRDRGDRQLVR
jgi:hypothetical protein